MEDKRVGSTNGKNQVRRTQKQEVQSTIVIKKLFIKQETNKQKNLKQFR